MVLRWLILVTFLPSVVISFFRVTRLVPTGNRCRASSSSLPTTDTVRTSTTDIKFDLSLAIILAGYAFQSYNDPPAGKVAYGIDGTNMTFCSADYVKRIFSGALLVDLIQGSFVGAKEEQFMERVLTGSNPDPRVVISVVEAPTSASARARVFDSARSQYKDNTVKPVWNESFYLYVTDPATAMLTFTALDRDVFKADDLLGVGSMSVTELQALSQPDSDSDSDAARGEAGTGTIRAVPVPLYMDDTDRPMGIMGFPFPARRKLKRTGTVQVDVRFVPWSTSSSISPTAGPTPTPKSGELLDFAMHPDGLSDAEASEMEKSFRRLPTGASPGLADWPALTRAVVRDSAVTPAKHRLSSGLAGRHLAQICSLDCDDTDTQASIWASASTRQVIVSFRGTEQVKFKDVLTDISLAQIPFEESNTVLCKTLAHQGFLTAYRSVRGAVLQTLHSLLTLDDAEGRDTAEGEGLEPWDIYVTGHSLGGALATLCAFDLARMREGLWGLEAPLQAVAMALGPPSAQTANNQPYASMCGDGAAVYRSDSRFLRTLTAARLIMYSFGAPRVGDPAFAALFDQLVPDSFRVVNNLDVVARIPRSGKANRLLQYEHVGRTALVDDAAAARGQARLWVQGEAQQQEGRQGVEDLSPFGSQPATSASSPPPTGIMAGASFLGALAARITSRGSASDTLAEVGGEIMDGWGKELQQRAELTSSSLSSQLEAAATSMQGAIPVAFQPSQEQRARLELLAQSLSSVPLPFNMTSMAPLPPLPALGNTRGNSTITTTSSSPSEMLSGALQGMGVDVQRMDGIFDPRQVVSSAMEATGLSDRALVELLTAGGDMLSALGGLGSAAADVSRGLEPGFVEGERQLLQAILNGTALEHHLEPSYFTALQKALDDQRSAG